MINSTSITKVDHETSYYQKCYLDMDVINLIQITSLKEEHLEDAALLVSKRYKKLIKQEPLLPQKYSEVTNLIPYLQNILQNSGNGVAAFSGNQLVGFLTAWLMENFRGSRSIYSPEWANAVDLVDNKYVYEMMYGQLAESWVADNYIAHYISLFPNDLNSLKALNWLGFGMISVDAICGLKSISDHQQDLVIQHAKLEDLEEIIYLQEELQAYMRESPIFLPSKERDRKFYQEWLESPDKVIWLAKLNNEPVAFIRMGPADDDVCTIINDKGTTSIYAAFALEKVRREGITTALLDHGLISARNSGYERCAVSFEPMNLSGTGFWLKHFNPVCYSFVRYIDVRLSQIQ